MSVVYCLNIDNVCFKKTKTIRSSDTLLRIALVFLKQTLIEKMAIDDIKTFMVKTGKINFEIND